MRKNKGMFLESLINRSNEYLWKNNLGFVEKRFTKVHISQIQGNKVSGFLASKNYVDYSGFIKEKPYEFEAKSTVLNKFYFKNIKREQLIFLTKVKKLGVVSFFIIYFYQNNKIIKLDVEIIEKQMKQNKKSISLNQAIKMGKELKVLYPGIIYYW